MILTIDIPGSDGGHISHSTDRISTLLITVVDQNGNRVGNITGDMLAKILNDNGFSLIDIKK